MKKCLSVILAALVLASALAGCAGQGGAPAQHAASNTNAPAATQEPADMPDESFCKEEHQMLLALQADDYQNMTVSEFQNKVWQMTDTPAYQNLLERAFKSEALYQMRDSDETAAFLFYVLEPLTAEKWQTRAYSGAAASDFPAWEDNAALEYTYTLTILDADRLMVKDYNDTRLRVACALNGILRNRTKTELQNEARMLAELRAYVDETLSYLQTPELGVAIEYAYFPLTATDGAPQGTGFDCDTERRRSQNGTEADYRALLTLKTTNYAELPLSAFNGALLEWTNENPERMERIGEDVTWDDFQIALTDEELSFVKLTVSLSGMENGKEIQSSYVGQPICPYYAEELAQRIASENGAAAWCSLYYQFSYRIADADAVTVGARDRQIGGMINAIRAFWDNTDMEGILKMSESDIVQELKRLAAKYSTDQITITIGEEQVHFERMDERQYAN